MKKIFLSKAILTEFTRLNETGSLLLVGQRLNQLLTQVYDGSNDDEKEFCREAIQFNKLLCNFLFTLYQLNRVSHAE